MSSSEPGSEDPAKAWVQRITLLVISLAVSFLLAESAWRVVMSSDTRLGRRLHKATLYADPFSDDLFWLLRHRWQGDRGRFKPPANPHPLLGWQSHFVGPDYGHREENRVAGRRPVLLFGDSFAQGTAKVEKFQQILNRDPDFSRHHYLLNYAVGGFGLDQIFLQFDRSVDRFENPFVIFSVMTFDLDRSALSVRIGQKPYFEVVEGNLELRGTPIASDPAEFFAANPPRVGSYLWRRFSRLTWSAGPDGTARDRERKRIVNGAILDAALERLEQLNTDYVIFVFHARKAFREGLDWRSDWLRTYLDARGAPYLWSYDLLQSEQREMPLDQLFDPQNVHPTTIANRILGQAMKEAVLKTSTSTHPSS